MRHRLDPLRRIYRTEYPSARPLDYFLMLLLAFAVGAIAVMALMVRVYGESRPSRGGGYVPATPENMSEAYRDILLSGAVGGTVAAILAAFAIRRSIRELRDRETRLRDQQLRDVRKTPGWFPRKE